MTLHIRSPRSFVRVGVALALLSSVFVGAASSGASSGAAWPTPDAQAMAERLAASTARGNGLIAFTSNRDGNKEVYSMFIDGLSQTNLTNNAADDSQAAWSPGGDKIAFTSTRSGNNDVWVMDPDGSNPVNLTNNAASDSQAAWSPDGLKIAFTSNRSGTNDVWVMNANGSNPVRLTKTTASETQPNYNPTGSKIAFTSDKAGNLDIWTVKPSGKGAKNLTLASVADDSDAAYSPDGLRIAFTSTRDGNNEIYVMGASGGAQTNFTVKADSDTQAAWAPDHGGRILFTSNRRLGNDDIHYMRGVNGLDPFDLNMIATAQDSEASWQPLPPYAPSGSPIEHIIFLVQENHSFDNVLGHLCVEDSRCEGHITGELSDGSIINLPPADDMVPKSPHSYDSHVIAMNGGQMNGYDLLGPDCVGPAYRCHQAYEPEQIPNLAALARQFTIADHSFETDGTGSYGTHLTMAASWLDGFYTATHHTPEGVQDGPGLGCDSNQVGIWYPNYADILGSKPTCIPRLDGTGPFEPSPVHWAPSIMSRLAEQGRSWRIYGAPFPASGNGYGWSICPSFADCLYDPDQHQYFVGRDQLFVDAAAGNLPDFAFVIPDNDPSQHNSRSMILGDNWIGDVADAIMSSPDWSSTALFITWDDCGCFYDHMAPPTNVPDHLKLGIRMPMVIVSPWAKPAFTDSTTSSWAGVLNLVERTFGLAPLSDVDYQSYPYSNVFDFTQEPIAPITLEHHPVPAWELEYMRTHPVYDEDDPT
jgi:phospholipase C